MNNRRHKLARSRRLLVSFRRRDKAAGVSREQLKHAADAQGRVAGVEHFADADGDHQLDAGEVLLAGFAYGYFADGSRRSEVWTDAAGRVTTKGWAYDGLNRLVGEQYDGFDGGGDALAYTDAFAFDLAGNRVSLGHDDRTAGGIGSAGPDATTAYAYDANDRLLSEGRDTNGDGSPERTTGYEYGPGNAGTGQTKKSVAGDQTSTTTFGYDATGRMTSVTVDGTTVGYKYDHNGFRVEASSGGATTVYHVDPSNMTGYAQTVEEGTDGGNGQPADGRLQAAEVGVAFTLGADVLAQATRGAGAGGATQQVLHLLYDAHGSDLGLTNPLTALRYAGESIDPLTGLSFNRARWYDTTQSRFKNLDKWKGDKTNPETLNKYVYANSDPANGSDPSGLFTLVGALSSVGLMTYGNALALQRSQITLDAASIALSAAATLNWARAAIGYKLNGGNISTPEGIVASVRYGAALGLFPSLAGAGFGGGRWHRRGDFAGRRRFLRGHRWWVRTCRD